jgi:hypothetical protein
MGFGKNAESEKFLMEGRDGKPDKEVTVAQYFKMELNMTVTKPGLPCVRYGKRNLVPYVVLLILVRKLSMKDGVCSIGTIQPNSDHQAHR